MEKRFRREKNISHAKKNTKIEETAVEQKAPAKASTGSTKKAVNPKKEVLAEMSHIYATKNSRPTIRNTILLVFVLFVLLYAAAWTLPRAFSVHIDFTELLKNITPTLGTEEEDTTKDFDILILGRGGYENDAPDLTDSIIVAHYGAGEKPSFTTISIPRDLFVKSRIAGKVKINQVYSDTKRYIDERAGFDHLLEIVSEMTGKQIKYYALIDFSGFRDLIDAVDGIDIDVPERLYDSEYPTKNWGYTVVDIQPGLQHFDGDKALKYARSRHTTSDFDRSRRQQLVINALREKMMTLDVLASPKKIQSLFQTLQNNVQTNMPLTLMFRMAKNAMGIQKENITSYSLDNSCVQVLKLCHPGGLLYTPERELFGGASVVIPKGSTYANLSVYKMIHSFVATVTTFPDILKQPPLTIVNASGKTGLAMTVALKLHSIGFPVSEDNLRNQTEKAEKTFIRYNSDIIQMDNILLSALSPVFSGEKRPATPEEKLTMVGAYELVLGKDASLYF